MARRIYISTNCFTDRDPDTILGFCEIYNYQRIELSAVSAEEEASVALAHSLRLRGVEVLLHNYYPQPAEPFTLNLASQAAVTLERSRAFCLRALELSAELGAPYYAAHAGFTMDLPSQLLGNPAAQASLAGESFWPRAACLATFAESVRLLTKHGRKLGVEFLIENHVNATAGNRAECPLLLCWEAEEIVRMAGMLGGELGLLVDFGHLKVSAKSGGFSVMEFMERVGSWIRAFHLSDNSGAADEHEPFDGEAWFLPVLRQHKEVPCTLEFNRVGHDEIRQTLQVLNNLEC
jgi:sugar phosphate isomerase/epimerase